MHIKPCAVIPPNRTESFPGSTRKTSAYSPGCKHHVANHSYIANESAPEAVYRTSFMQPKLFFFFLQLAADTLPVHHPLDALEMQTQSFSSYTDKISILSSLAIQQQIVQNHSCQILVLIWGQISRLWY